MQAQPVVHMDETGWSQAGERRWMWTALASSVAIFAIRAPLLGEPAPSLIPVPSEANWP